MFIFFSFLRKSIIINVIRAAYVNALLLHYLINADIYFSAGLRTFIIIIMMMSPLLTGSE